MRPAFPASDYYGPSAPTRRHQPATHLPSDRRAVGTGAVGSVPTFTLDSFDRGGAQLCPCGIATPTPRAFGVASLPATSTDAGVPHLLWVRTATQPRSVRFELVVCS